MKKIFAILLIILLILTLASCGNMSFGFGTYSFEHIHIFTYNEGHCFNIEEWHDCETGIEIKTKESGSLYASEGTYILFGSESDCPFCNGKDE